MIAGTALSVNKIQIRLTYERLFHITENHPELAGRMFEILEAIQAPDFVAEGSAEELLAVRKIDRHFLVVVYKETNSQDGFVITSFITSDFHPLDKRIRIWPPQS